MASKVQLRRDTNANWASAAPVLSAGELGLITDLEVIKVGDGTLSFAALPQFGSEQFVVLQSTYTLTSQTAAQKLFNATTNGALTLPVGTYFFDCGFSLSSMSTTSGSFGFAIGGTATITQAWHAIAVKAALATATSPQHSYNTAANTSIATATISATGEALITGVLRVTVAGTIIPQVSLGVAAAAVVGANSYFRIRSASTSTGTYSGNWS